MRAIFILLSVLAAVLFASAAKIVQNGKSLVLTEFKGVPGNARIEFPNPAAAAQAAGKIASGLIKRNL